MQEYAATELVELADSGRMSRREALGWLGKICGGGAAAAAFLAACSSDGGSAGRSDRPASTATSAPDRSTPPPTGGGTGHALSVAADDPAVTAEDVEFAGPASKVFGYLAAPKTGGPVPGVIVVHEIFGLNDHIRDVARRLAKVGYLALAPDLVSREGGTAASSNVIGALTSGPVEDRVADLRASADFLRRRPAFRGSLGVTGFCFGGGMTL